MPAERIHVRILGHTGRILGSYLHDKSRHSSFVAIMQLENLMSQSFLTDKTKEFQSILTSPKYLPMGVVALYFVDYVVEVCITDFLIFTADCLIFYRVRAQRSRWE
jgi:hypothetical protein